MRPIVLAVFFLASITVARAEDVSLLTMIQSIQGALLDAQNDLKKDDMLPLKKVTVKLKVINVLEASGDVGIWVFSFGGGAKDTTTSQVEMTLVPPDAHQDDNVSSLDDIRNTLSEAIFAGAYARSAAIQGQPPLKATEFKIVLEFALVIGANGKATIAMPPFSGSLSGKVSRENLQNITLEFGENAT